MKLLIAILEILETDTYPKRMPMIIIGLTFTFAAVLGYFVFLK